MRQKPIEIILMRQLASSLVMPIFIVDVAGTLQFYNEPAERILGRRFDETGEMSRSELAACWELSDADGAVLAPETLPLTVAVVERRPVHVECWLRGFDGVRRHIKATAIPLIAVPDRLLGAAAIFWEDAG
jgi:PAS domain-containing protein